MSYYYYIWIWCALRQTLINNFNLSMGDSKAKAEVVEVKAMEATAERFEEYGQVIEASPDGDEFGPQDAQLDLTRGIPRYLYILFLSMILSPP